MQVGVLESAESRARAFVNVIYHCRNEMQMYLSECLAVFVRVGDNLRQRVLRFKRKPHLQFFDRDQWRLVRLLFSLNYENQHSLRVGFINLKGKHTVWAV